MNRKKIMKKREKKYHQKRKRTILMKLAVG